MHPEMAARGSQWAASVLAAVGATAQRRLACLNLHAHAHGVSVAEQNAVVFCHAPCVMTDCMSAMWTAQSICILHPTVHGTVSPRFVSCLLGVP